MCGPIDVEPPRRVVDPDLHLDVVSLTTERGKVRRIITLQVSLNKINPFTLQEPNPHIQNPKTPQRKLNQCYF